MLFVNASHYAGRVSVYLHMCGEEYSQHDDLLFDTEI